nr:reverse transcriptase domain-containing protein [Tanacetum cinerariifolium]
MRISGFVHGITTPELIKRLHDKILKTMDEMMRVTTSFLRGEVAALNHERKKLFPPWRHQEGNQKQSFRKGIFRNQQRPKRKQDRFTFLTKTPKESYALEKGKFKASPPMTNPFEKRNHAKKFEFHGEVGHNTDESWMNFIVVRSPSPYNGIIRRSGVRKLQAVSSTAHEMLKIPIEGGIITLKSSMLVPLECAMVFGPEGSLSVTKPMVEKRIKVAINPKHPEQTVMIGSTLTEEGRNGLCNFLQHFKHLNKACPKDGYPVPEIDWKVESVCGFPFTCFLDAYKGYHQIQMVKEDDEKTAFITSQGIFCYKKMSFGLRNVEATYQRLVDKAFHKQIGRNLEVYVDDLVIKIRTEDEIARDIEETFKTLREINMKLNPKKCTFRIEEGMFLGYEVSTRGLKVCPDKVDAVLSLPSPKCLKDMQKSNGELASLNRFLAKSAKISLPFFKTLKKCTKKSDFHWTTKADEAFKALRGPEINYTLIEKLVLALVHASKHLKRYFQAHPIIVVTDQPIQQVLSRPAVAGRLQKWSIELGEYAIHYRPRVSVKGQILVDFIVERPEEDSPDTLMTEEEELPEPWILFTDGSSCIDGSRAGLILTNPEGVEFTYTLRFRRKNLKANVDSRLVANLVNGTYAAKETNMTRYLEKVKALTSSFKAFSIKQVPRSKNKKADALSKIASTSFAHLNETFPAEIKKARVVKRKSWRFAIINGTLYKKYFHRPWLRCIGPLQANYVLREIHEGSSSIHAGVIELYFVNTEYQLADLFTKALGRERIEFLTNKLGMRSFTPETLQKLMNEDDE